MQQSDETDTERAKARDVFKFIDKDGDGIITESEMEEICFAYKIFNKDEIKDAMKELGTEGMDFEKFYKFLTEKRKPSEEVEDEMKKAFNKFDRDGNGTIEKEEFTRVLKMGKEPFTDEEIENIFKEVDKNNDGVIDYEEFVSMING